MIQIECAKKDCTRKPTHYVIMKIPPKGRSMSQAMSLTFGIAMCRDHAFATEPEHLMNERGRGEIERVIKHRVVSQFEIGAGNVGGK